MVRGVSIDEVDWALHAASKKAKMSKPLIDNLSFILLPPNVEFKYFQ